MVVEHFFTRFSSKFCPYFFKFNMYRASLIGGKIVKSNLLEVRHFFLIEFRSSDSQMDSIRTPIIPLYSLICHNKFVSTTSV